MNLKVGQSLDDLIINGVERSSLIQRREKRQIEKELLMN